MKLSRWLKFWKRDESGEEPADQAPMAPMDEIEMVDEFQRQEMYRANRNPGNWKD